MGTAPPSLLPRPGVPGVIAAVLGALLVLGPPLAYWSRPEDAPGPTERAAALAGRMQRPPEVVVLGASKVGTDLDRAALARGLGTDPAALAMLHLSGTTAATWYAILDNIVYGRGYAPRLVVVYSTFDWALATAPVGEIARKTLMDLVEPGDDVVRQKALGGAGGGTTLERMRQRRTTANRAFFSAIRDLSVGLVLAPGGPEGAVASGHALAEGALEELFGAEAGLDTSATPQAIPIVEAERPAARAAADAASSLLGDFADLVAAHGGKLVFVDAPVKRAAQAQFRVEPEVMRDAVAILRERGVGFVDLAHPGMPDSAFGDGAHLNRLGRDALTAALLERLDAIGALGDGAMAPAQVAPVPPPMLGTRTGTVPAVAIQSLRRGVGACGWEAVVPAFREISDSALQAAGLGQVSPLVFTEDEVPLRPHAARAAFTETCSGAFLHQGRLVKFTPGGDDPGAAERRTYAAGFSAAAPLASPLGSEAWWVYPGTELRLDLPAPEGAAGTPAGGEVDVDALVFGPGTGQVTIGAPGEAFAAMSGDGPARHATVPFAGAVVVASPADGPFVLVRRVVRGAGEDSIAWLGSPGRQATGALGSEVVYAAAPPPLPALPPPTVDGPDTLRFDLRATGVPSTHAVRAAASLSGCSPIRVAAAGAAPGALVVREQDLDRGVGTFAQSGTDLLLRVAAPAAAPADPGAFTVSLDPARACQGMRWLYPGDRVEVLVSAQRAATLLGPVDRVEVGGVAFPAEGASPGPAMGRIEVRSGAATILDATFELDALSQRPPAWTLDPPAPVGQALEIALSTPTGAPFTLVTSIEISSGGAVPVAPVGAP